jgi:SAM-dependent methyltransferase
MMALLTQNVPEFWERIYASGGDNWSLPGATPALLEFFESPLHSQYPPSGSVLVPGAGLGKDAIAWMERGYDVLAVDFCPTAVDALGTLAYKHPKIKSLGLDMFELSATDPKKGGHQFDIVYEYNTFSAVHPGRRDEYLEMCHRMLKDDGVFIAFFFPLTAGNTMQGPPHRISEVELMARLDGIFEVEAKFKPTKSVPRRAGKEEIWVLKKSKE